MLHFVAYHKVEDFGEYDNSRKMFRHYSGKNRSVLERTKGETVWVISGERKRGQMLYQLVAVFSPIRVVELDSGNDVVGRGTPFDPPVELAPFPWFRSLLSEQGYFRFGLNRTYIGEAIDGLLGLQNGGNASGSLPGELPTRRGYVEGATRQVIVNAYERNPLARKECLAHYGRICGACDFDFATTYGELGLDHGIHVHHVRELAKIRKKYVVDPVADLRPVCPNCHAMLHLETPAMSIDKLRGIIARQRRINNGKNK